MKYRVILKAGIESSRVTRTKLYYQGSIGIDKALLEKTGIIVGEKVHVVNLETGTMLETYVLEEVENSGSIVLYGPAARCGKVGDRLSIASYVFITDGDISKIKEKIIYVNDNNKVLTQ